MAAAASGAEAINKGAEEEEERYGLTAMQEGMLFHSLLAPESTVYIVQKSYTLRGQLMSQRCSERGKR